MTIEERYRELYDEAEHESYSPDWYAGLHYGLEEGVKLALKELYNALPSPTDYLVEIISTRLGLTNDPAN